MHEDLKKGLLFMRLSEKQLERIEHKASRIRLAAGEMLFQQGEVATRFYLLLSGGIKLSRLSQDGREKVIELVSPHQTFAEALMFLDRPNYPVGAQALTVSEVISIDAGDFISMLRDSVDTCFLLMGDMSQRLRGLVGEIDNLCLHNATTRLANYLLCHLSDGGRTVTLSVPKQVLASRLSVKPETFSRIISQLSSRGLIHVEGNQVEILDIPELHALAEL